MDTTRFDAISRLFAQRRLSRRQAMQQGAAGLAAAGLAAAGLKAAAAQDATPAPTPQGGYTGEKISYLFVQSFQSGSIAPTEGTDGRYTVTLEHGLGQTLYFSDRPERIVGAAPTPTFLDGLGFLPDNPPNAALLLETASGETDIAVVELFNPTYDEATHTATYEVEVLESWQDELELGLSEEPADLAALAPDFGAAHLLIDDCVAETIYCHKRSDDSEVGELGDEMCYNYLLCIPCEPYGHTQPDRCSTRYYWNDKCTNAFAASCTPEEGGCWAEFLAADALCPGGKDGG